MENLTEEPAKCPPGYHKDLSGKCVQDITPPAPSIVEERDTEDNEG